MTSYRSAGTLSWDIERRDKEDGPFPLSDLGKSRRAAFSRGELIIAERTNAGPQHASYTGELRLSDKKIPFEAFRQPG
ncbi:hypothetical protein J2T17_002603 [Paenibacillus mucilaginosus]